MRIKTKSLFCVWVCGGVILKPESCSFIKRICSILPLLAYIILQSLHLQMLISRLSLSFFWSPNIAILCRLFTGKWIPTNFRFYQSLLQHNFSDYFSEACGWQSRYHSWLRITKSQVQVLLKAEFISWLYGALLHKAFHYRPSIFSVWLKLCWKGCKNTKSSSSDYLSDRGKHSKYTGGWR